MLAPSIPVTSRMPNGPCWRRCCQRQQGVAAPLLAAAAPRQRAVLRPTHGLRLALSAAGVSTMTNDLYDLSPVAVAWGVAVRPRGVAPRGSPPGGTPRQPLGGDHG